MIQTRHMKKNNITMDDIQTRDFHIKIYKNIKKFNISTYRNIQAREKINYIFNSFKIEIDLLPSWSPDVHNWRFVAVNICTSPWGEHLTNTRIDRCGWYIHRHHVNVTIIRSRYENKRFKIKQEIRKDCIPCSDAW